MLNSVAFTAWIATVVVAGLLFPVQAAVLTADEINEARYSGGRLPSGPSALTARVRILLDRHHASPGVIDGRLGDNVRKAISGFEEAQGLTADGEIDDEVWQALSTDGPPVMKRRTTRTLCNVVVTTAPGKSGSS